MCACMEHVCHTCGAVWFDNLGGGKCPQCQGYDVGHHFDESPADFELDEPEDKEE